MTQPAASPDLCTQAWTHREEILYPALFGRDRRGIFTIPAGVFTQTYQQAEYDSTWVRGGVFEFAPTERRASWLYATSGLSNAWGAEHEESEKPSGIGCEYVLELPDKATWAVTRLWHLMAYQIIVCHGRYPERRPMTDYDQIPLNAPIGTDESVLTCLLLAPPTGFPRRHQTRTGVFDFVQVVGITEAEAKAGQIHGGELLVKGLVGEGAFPVTLPERKSVL